MSNSPEIYKSPEKNNDRLMPHHEILEKKEHLESINDPESDKTSTEDLRERAIEFAKAQEKDKKPDNSSEKEPTRAPRGPISKRHKQENYNRVIKNVQNELPAGSRRFSKAIHSPLIEKTSDLLGSTIMRPRPFLVASISGFLFPLIAYLIAKQLGYRLSGSESIFAMAIGFIVGILLDYFRILIGKK